MCENRNIQSFCLLESGAHLTLSDIDGKTALHLASKSGCVDMMAEVIRACKKHGVNLSSARNSSRKNALHFYVEYLIVQIKGVQLLLDYGVDVAGVDINGNTPISLYLRRSLGSIDQDICKLLQTS